MAFRNISFLLMIETHLLNTAWAMLRTRAQYLLFCLALLLCGQLVAQTPETLEQISENEKSAWIRAHRLEERGGLVSANNRSDIRYCRLHWAVDPAVRYIQGSVFTVFEPLVSVGSLEFDFSASLKMDSIRYHGQSLNFTRSGDILTVNFPSVLPALLSDSVTFYYQGTPSSTGFGSFEVNQHAGTPILWTLSEPYGAMEWWPCKQALNDKIDSVDIFITHPEAYRAASNGLLVEEKSAGGLTTTHWRHRYPIAAYLICMAVTNYEAFTVPAPDPGGTTQIVNYVYPENLNNAKTGVADNVAHLQLYNKLFGLYPFQEEKYGHAQFGWGGGMEHQTITFVGDFGFELLAHELAHHWFGDKVTCGSWQDIWLNEGFATYLSGLCYENLQPQYWQNFKQGRINSVTSQPGGSVFVTDTSSVGRIFSGRLSYAKGAMVLHGLRWVCGDSAFFAGVRNYVNDPALAYRYARTADLQAHLEASSGKDLNGYFADWFTGQGYPTYQVLWSQDAQGTVRFTLNQTQSHPSVSFFEMPVPLRLVGANGQMVDVRLEHTFSGQSFTWKPGFTVTNVLFDPNFWLISKDNVVTRVSKTQDLAAQGYSLLVSPNPVREGTVRVTIQAPASAQATLSIISATGAIVLTQQVSFAAGANNTRMAVDQLPKGHYTLVLATERGQMTTKLALD